MSAATVVLGQFLLGCPHCGRAGVAHVNEGGPAPALVRFVCPIGCAVPADAVLERLIGT